MKQNHRLSLLLAVVAILGAIGMSNAASAFACDQYNDNAGYLTCAPVNTYPDQSRGHDYRDNNWSNDSNRTIWIPVPRSNQFVEVPTYMRDWGWGWVLSTDEWHNFGTLNLQWLGDNPRRPDGEGISDRNINYDMNYGGNHRPGIEIYVNGVHRGWT